MDFVIVLLEMMKMKKNVQHAIQTETLSVPITDALDLVSDVI